MDAPRASSGGSIKRICWTTPRSRVRIRRNFAPGRSASPNGFSAPIISRSAMASTMMASTSASCRLAPAVSFFCCFYLALDDSDNRPLMIDQPEENLDPQVGLRRTGQPLHRGQVAPAGDHGHAQRACILDRKTERLDEASQRLGRPEFPGKSSEAATV
jgi:hypothetical protein